MTRTDVVDISVGHLPSSMVLDWVVHRLHHAPAHHTARPPMVYRKIALNVT